MSYTSVDLKGVRSITLLDDFGHNATYHKHFGGWYKSIVEAGPFSDEEVLNRLNQQLPKIQTTFYR